MQTVSYRDVTLKSGFLYEKQLLNRNAAMDAVYDRFSETGRIGAFRFDWKPGMPNQPHFFWDSDVAKWMEGAAYILQKERDPELEAKVESLIDDIEAHQEDSGYFNIYFTVCEPDKRFSNRDWHELYCAGHLFEAAVAYYEATGKDRFLLLMEKYADFIKKIFVDEKSAAFSTPGHEEIELALIRMYRATGKKKFLDLAAFFINGRSVLDSDGTPYNQSHLPVREQSGAVGHCVRACYLYSAMANFAYETNDKELYNTCKALFNDIVGRKMYVTGGIGAARSGESFSYAYDLSNDLAYAETCAAIALMFFAHRMMRFENDPVYADVIERILYNGMISGLSLDGKSFFYENPLEINLERRKLSGYNYAITTRVAVFSCSCCPPNLNRVLASLGDYIYGYESDTVYVNQFAGSEAKIGDMHISQTTDFPKSNVIRLSAKNVKKLCVRIPGWCASFDIDADFTVENGYAVIENPEGEITVKFEITPFAVQSNSRVDADCGKLAVCCGPYVCAAEAIDNTEDLHTIFIDENFSAEYEYSDRFDGFTVKVKAFRRTDDDALYSKYPGYFEDFTLKMIPFASFANRGESNMCVWFNFR